MNDVKSNIKININKEIKVLLENGFIDSAFLICIMGIEFLGAMVDEKPIRANGQSSKRFKIGLRKFFPKRYGKPSITEVIYKGLRCNVGHLLQFSTRIEFTQEISSHLNEEDLAIKISKKQFIKDYILATEKMNQRFTDGIYQLKKGVC